MIWNKVSIAKELRKLHDAGIDISYNRLCKRKQSLVSAAAYHFGSYRRAVEKADIPYEEVVRRPRWTRQHIIGLLKKARREDQDLHWSAVTQRRDELGRAAFASLQPRLFGSWDRALHGAGLDADEISRYRKWDKATIISELKARKREGDLVSSGAVQKDDPGLHAAAVRNFGGFSSALSASGIDVDKVRKRRAWDKGTVAAGLTALGKKGVELSDSAVRKADPGLHGAAVRLFGSFTKARSAGKAKATPVKASKKPKK